MFHFQRERLVEEPEQLVELGSDQTSCHNPFNGGYYPVGLTFTEANELMAKDKAKFVELVKQRSEFQSHAFIHFPRVFAFPFHSLLRQIAAIQKLSQRGMHFWDYGNAFLVECQRAGANTLRPDAKDDKTFIFPGYIQDILGSVVEINHQSPFFINILMSPPSPLQ